MKMDKLKYTSSERYYEGVITEVTDGGISIELKGRLGRLILPKRMIISDYPLEIGSRVGFLMTYPEVIDEKQKQY